MYAITRLPGLVAVGALAEVAACGGGDVREGLPAGAIRVPPVEWMPRPDVLPVKTATQPESPCGWIAAAEVGRPAAPRGGAALTPLTRSAP